GTKLMIPFPTSSRSTFSACGARLTTVVRPNCFAPCVVRDTCFAPERPSPMFSSLRARLTLWYVGAFSAVLILFSAGVYFSVDRTLRERLDTKLLSTLQIASSAIAHHGARSLPGSETLENPRFPGQVVALLDLEGRVLAKRPTNSALPLRL